MTIREALNYRSAVESAKRTRGRTIFSYVVALLGVGLATGINWVLWRLIQPQVSPLFFAAVMVSAWYGGLGPGLLATALAGLLSVYLFMEPQYTLDMDLADVLRLIVFLLVALLVSWQNWQRNRAQQALQQARDDLENRVTERTAQLVRTNQDLEQEIATRQRTEADLLANQQRLRHLASELSLIEQRERRRIASRLHDDVGQLLSLGHLKLENALESAPADGLGMTLEEVRELLDQAIERARTLTCELSPPVLYQLGFEAGLSWLAEQTQKQSGVRVSLENDSEPKPISEDVQVLLFQAVRELLANVVKHSKAAEARIRVSRDGELLKAVVEDDGQGFDTGSIMLPQSNSNCFGLFNIRERLRDYGGQLVMESAPGHGTIMTLTVPLNVSEGSHNDQYHDDPHPAGG